MKEKILFLSVLFFVALIFLVILIISFKKKKAYITRGIFVKKEEHPFLFWTATFINLIIFLFFLLLIIFYIYYSIQLV